MSYSIIQQPQPLALAQSPIIFSISSSQYVSNLEFQYIVELTIWTGSTTTPTGSETWQLAKYPSSQGLTGIFDCSRIINSTQTELVQQNPSPIKNYKIDSWARWQSGSVYVTGSHVTSSVFQAADGYEVFPEEINQGIGVNSAGLYKAWPLMYDGPLTQSCFIDNQGLGYVYMIAATPGDNTPNRIKYESDAGTQYYNLSTGSLTNSNNLVQNFPMYPSESGFPLDKNSISWYSITAMNGDTAISNTIRFNYVCQQKYPNIRIKFKNRFGALQYMNLDLVNRKSFSSTKRTYQPQLGQWQARTLSYNQYDSQTLNYIVDSVQKLSANTNWLAEEWNEIIKQLLVSDEIYWVNEGGQAYEAINWTIKPLTITTQNIVFKTGVNDHLIQYQFEFDYGQGYKLII